MAKGSARLRGTSWQLRVYGSRGRQMSRTLAPVNGRPLPRKQVDAELRKLLDEADRGSTRGHGKTVEALLASYVSTKRAKWSAGTLREHQRIINRYIVPHLGDIKLAALVREPERIDDAWNTLRAKGGKKGRPLSEATVARTHVVLHAALELAVRRRWLPGNPAEWAERPAPEDTDPTAPDIEDIKTVLACLARHDPLLYALVHLDANTGARRGELAALRWTDLDLDTRTARIHRAIAIGPAGVGLVEQATKTKTSRTVNLGEDAVTALRLLRADREQKATAVGYRGNLDQSRVFASGDPPWTDPPWPSTLTRRLRLLRTRHQLPAVTMLALRHHVATQLLDRGESIKTAQGRVGHARGSTTLDAYAASLPASDQRAADLLNDLLR